MFWTAEFLARDLAASSIVDKSAVNGHDFRIFRVFYQIEAINNGGFVNVGGRARDGILTRCLCSRRPSVL